MRIRRPSTGLGNGCKRPASALQLVALRRLSQIARIHLGCRKVTALRKEVAKKGAPVNSCELSNISYLNPWPDYGVHDRTVASWLEDPVFVLSRLSNGIRICGEAVAESESFARVQRRVRASLGRKVKDLRLSLEMTQTDLADEAEIRRALVSDIERGKANPTLDSIVRLATALGVEAAELLNLDR